MKPKNRTCCAAMASLASLKLPALLATLALALGSGLTAVTAQAQVIHEVGGIGVIGDEALTSGNVPAAGADWTVDGTAGVVYSGLVSTAETVGTGGDVILTFDHTYDFEEQWDGGTVFVSINGGAFTYVPDSAFTANGYDGNPNTDNGSSVWTGAEDVFYSNGQKTVQSVANLGNVPLGQTVAVEFRGGWDEGTENGPPAWVVSTVKLTDAGAADILDVDFDVDGPSGFTQGIATAGNWNYLKSTNRFELDAVTDTADRYAPVSVGTVIDLNDANIEVVLHAGTLVATDSFTLFDLSGGTTLTGSVGNLTLPAGTWDTTQLGVDGTITYVAPPLPTGSQLGVLDLDANGGINPSTGQVWVPGDTYRLVFLTSQTTNALSPDISTYNSFVQGVAASSTTYPNLGNAVWRIVGSTETVGARDNTGTNPGSGTGDTVFLIDGTTKIADNSADLWDGGIDANISLDENAVSISEDRVFTGSENNGTSRPLGGTDNPLGVASGVQVQTGGNASLTGWLKSWKMEAETEQSVYAMSYPLTVVDTSDSVDPNLVSMVDDRSGADIVVGLGSIVYTVSFDEGMNPGTVELADFEIAGASTGTATIDQVVGTLDSSTFEVTVTPTLAGTIQLQIAASSTLEDFNGNSVDTLSAIPDDTIITAVNETTPPSPDAMTWAVAPAAASFVSITMTATTATDASGVQYYFDETSGNPGGSDSSWQDSPTYVNTGLDPLTTYSYQVKARDKSALNNETGFSSVESAATPDVPNTPFVYEGFDYTAASVIGQTGGTGWDGAWVGEKHGGAMYAFDPGNTYGSLETIGLQAGSSGLWGSAYRTFDTAAMAPLLSDGGELWFSIIIDGSNNTDWQSKLGFMIGNGGWGDSADTLDTGFGSGIGIRGGNSKDASPLGVIYGSATGGTGSVDGDAGPALVVGHIQWGASGASETLTLYAPDTNLNMGASVGTLTMADVDQASFDRVAVLHKDGQRYDEIRIGATYDSVVIAVPGDYDNWAAGSFLGTLTDATASLYFDGGGLQTGVEWVVGGDPTDPSDDAGLAPTGTEDGAYLVYTYNRTDESNADTKTTIAVEYGSDLVGWTTAVHEVAGVIITETDNGATDSVEVKIPMALAADGKLFARLDVVIVP